MELNSYHAQDGRQTAVVFKEVKAARSYFESASVHYKVSATGWVRKMANAAFSKGLEAKEWPLEAVGAFTSGGSN